MALKAQARDNSQAEAINTSDTSDNKPMTAAAETVPAAPMTNSVPQLDLDVPEVDERHVVTDDFRLLCQVTGKLLERGEKANTLLLGPAGCGKTTTAQQLAAQLGLPYLHINCATIREASQLFGSKEVENGKTFFRESRFVQVLEHGNAVICLDEINRTSPMALNGLLSCMDGSSPWVEDLERHVVPGPNLVFIGACNVGAAYSGTHRLDRALDNRFQRRIEVGYLPNSQEVDLLVTRAGVDKVAAERLVRIAEKVRHEYDLGKTYSEDISTRVLLAAAQDFAALEEIEPGSGPRALRMVISNRFNRTGGNSSERNALSVLLDGQFGSWADDVTKAAKKAAEEATAVAA